MDKIKSILKNKIILFAGVALLVIVIILTTGLLSKDNSEVSLLTVKAEKGTIISSVSASGQVLSVNIMSANTKASGIVKKVYVADGDVVKKGSKILDIDLDFQGEQKHLQAWSSYLSAKNNLESAQAAVYTLQSQAFAANQKLINDAVARELEKDDPAYIQQNADWLAAEAKYKIQQQVIDQAKAFLSSSWLSYQLASSTITSPTDGVITSLMYIVGMSIGSLDTGSSESNQKVATIKTEGSPILSTNLSEVDVFKVNPGQKATVIVDSITDKTFTGEVVGVDRIGQTTNGVTQYPAIIKLNSSSLEILPNMAVTANIIIDHKNDVLLLPSGAVQFQDDNYYVKIIKNGEQEHVLVETGLSSETQVEIVSGISEGDEVVSDNSFSSSLKSETNSPFGSSGMGGMMKMVH